MKTARANRLTKEQQQQWWNDNADMLKRDREDERTNGNRPKWGAAEIASVTYRKGEAAPKGRNTYGYDLPVWWAGDWSLREVPGMIEGHVIEGLIQTNPKDKRERSAWLEETPKERKEAIQQAKWMMTAKGAPKAEPWMGKIHESAGKRIPAHKETPSDTRGDLTITAPSWMGQPSPMNGSEEKEAHRCLVMKPRTYADVTWTLQEAEPMWWNRSHKGSVLKGDVGAARSESNKYGKKVAALDKQLKAALADKGRRAHGPTMRMSDVYKDAAASAPWDLVSDTTDVDRRDYEDLKESLTEWITPKEMEALMLRTWGRPQIDKAGYALKRAQRKALEGLEA